MIGKQRLTLITQLTGAIGYNETQGGSIGDFVDDHRFGNNHSYEWDENIQDQQLQQFYPALMSHLGLTPNP